MLTRSTPEEIAHQINNSAAKAVFVSPSHVEALQKALPRLKSAIPDSRIVLLAEKGTNVAGLKNIYDIAGAAAVAERFEHEPNATAVLFYSSGTTGLPKGVMTTHYNLTTQMQCGRMAFEPLYHGRDKVLCFLPMSHIYGCMTALIMPIAWGVQAVIMPKYEEITVLSAIEKYKITVGLLVPPVLLAWMNSVNVPKYDLTSLRAVMCGAAPLSGDLVKEVYRRFTFTLFESYGECRSSVRC